MVPAAPAVAPTTAATTAPATWQNNPYLTAQHLTPLQQQQQQQLAKQLARVGLANQGQLLPSSTVSTMAAGGPIPTPTQFLHLFRPVPAAPPHPPGKAPGPPPSPFTPPPPPPAPSPATPAPAPAPPPPPPPQNFVQAVTSFFNPVTKAVSSFFNPTPAAGYYWVPPSPPPPPPAAAVPVTGATTAAAAGPTAAATGRPVQKDIWVWRAPGTGTHGQVSGAGHVGSCEHRKTAAPAGTAAGTAAASTNAPAAFITERWNLPDVAACKASCAANATCVAVQWSASTKYTRCVLYAAAPERVLPVPGYECWLKELAPQGGGARGGSARGRSPSKEGTSSQYIDCSDPAVATSEGTSYAKLKGFPLKQGGATCQHHAKPGANSLDRPLLDPS